MNLSKAGTELDFNFKKNNFSVYFLYPILLVLSVFHFLDNFGIKFFFIYSTEFVTF